jgi:ubiquinone/menaquinone biosynthesis C-methylase UbiE
MSLDRREIAASFDARAPRYAANDWHRHSAERLVGLCGLVPGSRVLDAGTGTGFAALAAARAVGREGHVLGVDLSGGMLREARLAAQAAGLTNVEFREGDAVFLDDQRPGTFDIVTCAAGLLYMPIADALQQWHRLLKEGGVMAFSGMSAGSPPAGRIFRDCAAAFGVAVHDPSEPLGSPAACRAALAAAGFEIVDVVSETMEFTTQDLTLAWESNVRSAGHAEVQRLSDRALAELRRTYLDALAREESEHPGALSRAEILYALGRRAGSGQ